MKFIFPDVGEGIHEAKIVNLTKKVGDTVKKDETLCEVETDKSIVEIPSPETGTITEFEFQVGDTIHVGDVLAIIEPEAQEDSTSTQEQSSATNSDSQPAEATKDSGNVVGSLVDADSSKFSDLDFSNYQSKSYTRPESGSLLGSNKKDSSSPTTSSVSQVSTSSDQSSATQDANKLSPTRLTISRRMRESLINTAQVTQMDDLNIENIYEHRQSHKQEAKDQGVKLTYLPYFIMALIETLKEFPDFNAEYDSNNQTLTHCKEFHIAIAVDTPYGLMVPVLRNAENYNLFGLAKEVTKLAKLANDRNLSPEQQSGSTITITNFGSLGTKYATPILNTPNTANIGLGTLDQKIVVEQDHIESFTIAPISLTYAHDVIDGGNAARFLQAFQKHLSQII